MTNDRNALIHISDIDNVTGSSGATNIAFGYSIINDIQSHCEGLAATDGQKAVLLELISDILITSGQELSIAIVLFQTNGTFTNSNNLNDDTIHDILNSCIDDVFGYQVLHAPQLVRQCRLEEGSTGSPGELYARQYRVRLPNRIVKSVNREMETERLQHYGIAIVGKARVTTQSFEIYDNFICKYREEPVSITIR